MGEEDVKKEKAKLLEDRGELEALKTAVLELRAQVPPPGHPRSQHLYFFFKRVIWCVQLL